MREPSKQPESIKNRAREYAQTCKFDDNCMFLVATVNGIEYTVRVYAGSPLGKEIEQHIREEIAIRVLEDGTIK